MEAQRVADFRIFHRLGDRAANVVGIGVRHAPGLGGDQFHGVEAGRTAGEYNTRYLTWLLTVLICLAGLSSAAAQQPAGPASVVVSTEVDGSKNPELIPDTVAFRHFLGLLSGMSKTGLEKEHGRSYVKAYFRPQCGPSKSEDRTLTDQQVERLLAMADEFQRRTASLKDAAVVTEAARQTLDTLDRELSVDGANKVRQHLATNVKVHMKKVRVSMPSGAT